MAQEWLSLAEISRRTGIAESSLRRYARNFAPHLLQEQSGKRWVFAEESVEVFDRIGTAYREGKTTEEVARMLETTPTVKSIDHTSPGGGPSVPAPAHQGAAPEILPLSSASVALFFSTVQTAMERMAEALEAVQHRDQERVRLLEEKSTSQENLLEDQRLRIKELEQKLHRVESLLFLAGDEKTTPLVVKDQLEKLQGDLAMVRQIQEKEAVVRILDQPTPRPPWWRRLLGLKP